MFVFLEMWPSAKVTSIRKRPVTFVKMFQNRLNHFVIVSIRCWDELSIDCSRFKLNARYFQSEAEKINRGTASLSIARPSAILQGLIAATRTR